MTSDFNALWTEARAAGSEAEAVRVLKQISSSKEGRVFLMGLELTDAALCIEILDHVRSHPLPTVHEASLTDANSGSRPA